MSLLRRAALVAVLTLTACGGQPVEPAEDEPGWNCAKHGNRICGSSLTARAAAAAHFGGER